MFKKNLQRLFFFIPEIKNKNKSKQAKLIIKTNTYQAFSVQAPNVALLYNYDGFK